MKLGKRRETENNTLVNAGRAADRKGVLSERMQNPEIRMLKDAKAAYRKAKESADAAVLQCRRVEKENREKQKMIRKSFDTSFRKESKAMNRALARIGEDSSPERGIRAAEEISQILGYEGRQLSNSEFADLLENNKPLVL